VSLFLVEVEVMHWYPSPISGSQLNPGWKKMNGMDREGREVREEIVLAREINYVFPLSDMRSTEEVQKVR